jgi:DNA-binding MarR family transcriptional regulator
LSEEGLIKTSELSPQATAATDTMSATFRLHGHLIALGDRMVQPFNLTSARWQVMGSIVLSESDVTVPQIARNLGLSRQAVQRVANDLNTADLIIFDDNPHHKRAKLIRLTLAGEKTYHQADKVYAQWANKAFAGLPPAQLREAITLLEALDALCRDYLDARPSPMEGK